MRTSRILAVAITASLALILCACSTAGTKRSATMPTGMFTDMRYHAESGDVVGTEVLVVYSRDGYRVVYQSSEGEPGVPVVVPAKVEGMRLTFDVPASADPRGTFNGTFDAQGLEGDFSGSGERIHLTRAASYWAR